MENVPIVTDVTKAQLDALVTGSLLEEGLQYSVTDKGWLLIAISANTLSPATDFITIIYTDTLPSYIISNLLRIETGIIESINGGAINITVPTNYIPTGMFIKNHNTNLITGISVSNAEDSVADITATEIGVGYGCYVPFSTQILYTTNFNLQIYVTDNNTGGSNWIIEFRKCI